MDGSAASMASTPGAAPSPADFATLQQMFLQQQQQLQHLAHQQQQQQPSHAAPSLDMATLAALLQQQQQAAQQQQLQATAQLLALQALGQLPTFSGKGASTGLAALEWLQHAERYFAARETALGITEAEGDVLRAALVANAMQDDAQRWFNALPSASRPSTWKTFREERLPTLS